MPFAATGVATGSQFWPASSDQKTRAMSSVAPVTIQARSSPRVRTPVPLAAKLASPDSNAKGPVVLGVHVVPPSSVKSTWKRPSSIGSP